jgi:hypothetical protein
MRSAREKWVSAMALLSLLPLVTDEGLMESLQVNCGRTTRI